MIDFRDYRPGHRARAPQRGRPGRHGGGDALRRRARRRQRGLPRAAAPAPRRSRCRRRAPTAAGTWQSASARGRSTARTSITIGSTRGRATAAPNAGRSSTTRTACTRCTSTASSSACSSAAADPSTRASGSAGRTRSACCPNETVTVLAWFAPYSGRYVFHCHALEHADKAMMLQHGGGCVRRRVARCALAALAALAAAPAASAQGPVIAAVDGLTGANNRWDPRDVDGASRRHGDVALRRHAAAPTT